MINIIKEKQALSLARTPEGRIQGLVAVHSGVFHADDVFFIATLTLARPELSVVRTRNPQIIEAASFAGDVGGEYDGIRRFDHHQKGGAGGRTNGVPYAAFGLFWSQPGWPFTVVQEVVGDTSGKWQVIEAVDESLVQAIDAADCGWVSEADLTSGGRMFLKAILEPVGDEPPFRTPRYSLSAAISAFNPDWSEADQDFDAAFVKAVEFAQAILRREIIRAAGEVMSVATVRAAIAAQQDPIVTESEILVLNRFCPWQETVIAEAPSVKFVVFPSETGDYRIQAVPKELGSFETRQLLPEAWAGLRGAELAAAVRTCGGTIGDAEAVFCHNGRFIAGATSFEGAMQMARAACGQLAEVEVREKV